MACDGAGDSAARQLERERAAISCTRRLLAGWPAARRELRELLWQIDDGQAVDTSGVPDPSLKEIIQQTFQCLDLRHTGQVSRATGTLQLLDLNLQAPTCSNFMLEVLAFAAAAHSQSITDLTRDEVLSLSGAATG